MSSDKYPVFDAFDLLVEYDFHGDSSAALTSLSKQFKSNQIMDKKVIPFFSNNVEKTYDLEDLQGLADKFQDAHKGHIRIQNSDREVYIYTDGVWRADNKGGRSRFRFISEFIDSCGDSKLAKKMKHQRGLARDMLDSCDRLSTDFNTRRELIVMSGNKTFDSKTGEVRDSSPDDLSTLCTKVRYNPNAKSKVWDDFLQSRFPDAKVLSYFQRSVGSAIVGAREKNFFFLLGDGNDAKSTLKKIISEALGDYVAKDLPLRALVSDDRASARLQSSLANLENKKIAFVTECEKADLRDVAPLKQITGGDGISASGMYKDPRYIDPHARLFLIGNKRLDFDITDVAIVDRLRVIRLETIPLEVRDPDFFDKFVSDSNNLEAVLLWLIDCALEYKQNGLKNVPDIITEWTMEMLYDELPAAMLCCFEKDANSSLTYTEVESELKKSGFNTKDLNKTTIGISIKKLFDIEKSKSRIVTYKGIKPKSMIKNTTPVSQPAEKTGAEKTSDISECYDADHQLHQFSAENSEKNRISNLVDIEGEYRGAEIEKSEFLAGNAAKTGVTGARGIEHLDNKEEFSAPVFSEVKDNW
jgi:P4 family phage/plasmid primase-like protien